MSEESESRVRGSVPSAAITQSLIETLDPDTFTPRLLHLLSTGLVRRESNLLRSSFALGTNDWRILSALATRPGSTSTDVCDFLVLNKAIVSKSVNILAERELILLVDGPRGTRPMYLTEAGAEMHHNMLPISRRGQEIILDGMTADEIEAFNNLLNRMIAKLNGS